MRATRIFLGASALVWLPYGVFCFLVPDFLGDTIGLAAGAPTARTELRAMYGGLQAGLGSLALGGALRAELRRPALLALAFLCAGLALARGGGALVDGGVTGYTAVGLLFEIASALLAGLLLRAPAQASRRAIP
jgi:hypothetical protein